MDENNGTKRVLHNNLIALGILVLIFGIWILVANVSRTFDGSSAGNNTESTPASSVESNEVTQSDLEALCQDDSVIRIEAYFGSDKISLVKATDYNPFFEKLEKTASGDDVHFFQWNGKNKTDGSTVRFTCYATGEKNNLTLRYLSTDNAVIFGSLDFYN